MTTTELKGTLIARLSNLKGHLKQRRQTLILIEADVIAARAGVDQVQGQITATEAALEDMDAPFVPPPPPKPTPPAVH